MTAIYTKVIYIFATLAFASIYVRGTDRLPNEETSIDRDKQYETNQDIHRAMNISSILWLLGFNYVSPHTANKSCVYLSISSLTPDCVKYSSNFIKYNNCKGHIDYAGMFYNSPYVTNGKKEEPVRYSNLRAWAGNWIMNYTLIYSDYEECLLFRVPNMHNGTGCMILVTDLEKGMSSTCEATFNKFCGMSHNIWKVPGTDCEDRHKQITETCDLTAGK